MQTVGNPKIRSAIMKNGGRLFKVGIFVALAMFSSKRFQNGNMVVHQNGGRGLPDDPRCDR
jgi:hypothetical protein